VEVVVLGEPDARPRGPRYGTLVHASLATVPLHGDGAVLDRIVATEGRIVGAPADEIASAQAVVRAVLGHPLLEAARRADGRGALYRETPLTILRDGTLLEGTVDLAFENGEHFVVIDFKTDRPDGETGARYARQVRLYAEALAEATGKPAHPVLMTV